MPCFVEPFAQILSTHDGSSVELRREAEAVDHLNFAATRPKSETPSRTQAASDAPGRACPLTTRWIRREPPCRRRTRTAPTSGCSAHCSKFIARFQGGRATLHVDVGATAPRPIRDFSNGVVHEPRQGAFRYVWASKRWSRILSRRTGPSTSARSPATLRFDAPSRALLVRHRVDAPLASSGIPSFTGACFSATRRRSSLTAQVRAVANGEILPTMHRIARELWISSSRLSSRPSVFELIRSSRAIQVHRRPASQTRQVR